MTANHPNEHPIPFGFESDDIRKMKFDLSFPFFQFRRITVSLVYTHCHTVIGDHNLTKYGNN